MAHAFYFAGSSEEGRLAAQAHLEEFVEGRTENIQTLSFESFPVEEARRFKDVVYRTPVSGDRKGVILSVHRIFHEAQNALLKVFEEPPEGTMLVLVVPSAGILLPTLRSRLVPLPTKKGSVTISDAASAFIQASSTEREKIVEKLLVRAKSDKQEEKGAARAQALQIVEGLLHAAHARKDTPSMKAFLTDLDRFIPILHERSAPLKLIFEHILLTIPKDLTK